jgi:hypothetical protein
MSFSFDGAFGTPGIYSEVGTFENQFWWEKYSGQVWFSSIISGAARDNGNTSYETVLRPGLLMGLITSSKKLVQWDPTATDGSQRIFGVLGYSLKMQRLGSNIDRHYGIMVAGMVKASKLIVPGTAALGIAGTTNEHLIRAQMNRRFLFDDLLGGNPWGGWQEIRAVTDTTLTVTEAMNNTLFTNRGAGGNIAYTLPATAKKGLRYGFMAVAAGTVTVTAGTADTLVTFNDAAADSIAYSTAAEIIGNFVEVIGDGTGWLVLNHLGAETSTPTIAT